MLSRIAQVTFARAKPPRKHASLQGRACFRGGVTGFGVFGRYRESMALGGGDCLGQGIRPGTLPGVPIYRVSAGFARPALWSCGSSGHPL
jgi:hypothetical protein